MAVTQNLSEFEMAFITECYKTNFVNPSAISSVLYMKEFLKQHVASDPNYQSYRAKIEKELGRINSNLHNPNQKKADATAEIFKDATEKYDQTLKKLND